MPPQISPSFESGRALTLDEAADETATDDAEDVGGVPLPFVPGAGDGVQAARARTIDETARRRAFMEEWGNRRYYVRERESLRESRAKSSNTPDSVVPSTPGQGSLACRTDESWFDDREKRYDPFIFPRNLMNFRPYVAELLGTLALTLIVALASGEFIATLNIPTAYYAGMALGLFVYTVGSVSGAHLNPAVTIALATLKKISVADAVYYILSQFAGAFIASVIAWKVQGNWVTLQPTDNTVLVTLAEAAGAFVLMWGIMSVVEGKVSKDLSGVVIGGSLAFGCLLGIGLSGNGVLNPAVAFGLQTLLSAYLVGPIVGAIAAAWLYRWIATTHQHHHHAEHHAHQA